MNILKSKNMTVAIWDFGTFGPYLAERLARDCKKVYLCCPRSTGFPMADRDLIGTGIPGVTKILETEFFERVPEYTYTIFPFIGHAGIQLDIVRQGGLVLGTRKGDEIEKDRKLFKQILLNQGLHIVPFNGEEKIMETIGFDATRSLMQGTKNKWIKFSEYRGVAETYQHLTYEESEDFLFEMAHNFGSHRHNFSALWEDHVKGVEVGDDSLFSNGKYLSKCLWGIEKKDESYSCRVISHDKLPYVIKQIHDGMTPIMAGYGVHSPISAEYRVAKRGLAYFIDPTQRFGSPPGEIICEIWDDLPELFRAISAGEDIVPKEVKKYGASVFLYSGRLIKEVTPVTIPEKFQQWVKLQNFCIDKDGTRKCWTQDAGDVLGSAVGLGDSLAEAQCNAMEAAESVKAEGIYFNSNTFDEADESIAEAKRLGVW
jgi:hypothetical protein